MANISNDYQHIIMDDLQVYTSKEIGIPGLRIFGHQVNFKAQKPLELHIHPHCIEICFVSKGNQYYTTTAKEYLLTGDTVFVTMPKEVHGSGIDPFGKLDLYWLQLDVNFEKNFLSLELPYSGLLLNSLLNIKNQLIKCRENLKPLIETAMKNITSENETKKLLGLSSLLLFLNKIIEYDEANSSCVSPKIQKAIEYIESNIENNIPLHSLAEYIGLSLSHFKSRFKKETGETPNDYINYIKIQKSKELLASGKMSVTETAYRLDFSSSAYFSVVFKRHTSMSPSEYLKSLNAKDKGNLRKPAFEKFPR